MSIDHCDAADCGQESTIRFMFNDVTIRLCTRHVAQLAIVLIEKSELPTFRELFNEGVVSGLKSGDDDLERAWDESKTKSIIDDYLSDR